MKTNRLFISSQYSFNTFAIQGALDVGFGFEELALSGIYFEQREIEKLILLLETLPIKSVQFTDCKFTDTKSRDFSKCQKLVKVQLLDCDASSSFAINCSDIPNLQVLTMAGANSNFSVNTTRSVLPNNLTELAIRLENRYDLREFACAEIEIYLVSTAEIRNLSRMRKMVVDASQTIHGHIERNKRGRQRCRDVIYTLFLIKYYSTDNVFRLIDKYVLMIIAKHLYASVGSKAWCD